MLRSQRRRESKCQEARRTRLQETAASDVPLGTTVRDVVLLPWYSDHNFPYSLQGLLENSEMGAQGEMAHFYPSCHLCSHRWERRDEDGEGPSSLISEKAVPKKDEDKEEMFEEEQNGKLKQELGGQSATSKTHPKRPLLGLVLTPTRELAVQVRQHIDAVARFTGEA